MTDQNDADSQNHTPSSGLSTGSRGGGASAPSWERATLEKLAFAALAEQRSARRWKTFIRLSWLVFLIALVWLAMDRETSTAQKSSPHTALVEIKGEIASGGEASADVVITAARAAFEDEGAKAVVLLINSPGEAVRAQALRFGQHQRTGGGRGHCHRNADACPDRHAGPTAAVPTTP